METHKKQARRDKYIVSKNISRQWISNDLKETLLSGLFGAGTVQASKKLTEFLCSEAGQSALIEWSNSQADI
jgi:hypothetical protein